ncbi:hypothetical protein [Terrabacter koreensis]
MAASPRLTIAIREIIEQVSFVVLAPGRARGARHATPAAFHSSMATRE